MQIAFLILLLTHACISSALRIACIRAERISTSDSIKSVPSSEVRKSITEIARRNDIVLIQGIYENWLSYIQKMLHSELQVYSLILTQPNGNQQYAYLFKTEKIKLLEKFNRSLEGDAPGTSSVLVKDMIGGLPDFVLLSNAKGVPALYVTVPATASGTDMKVMITPLSGSLQPVTGDFATMSQKAEEDFERKGKRNSCTRYRISASANLLNEVVITPLIAGVWDHCAYGYSSAEFLITSQQSYNRLVERGSSGSSEPPAVLKSSRAQGIAAAEAIGAALGSIAIFCVIFLLSRPGEYSSLYFPNQLYYNSISSERLASLETIASSKVMLTDTSYITETPQTKELSMATSLRDGRAVSQQPRNVYTPFVAAAAALIVATLVASVTTAIFIVRVKNHSCGTTPNQYFTSSITSDANKVSLFELKSLRCSDEQCRPDKHKMGPHTHSLFNV
ncbi:hypothetical protein EMCRGX_G023189 [Ephydatia muelleri]